MPRSDVSAKYELIQKVMQCYDKLYGKYASQLTGEAKSDVWQEIFDYCKGREHLWTTGKDVSFLRQSKWPGIKRDAFEHYQNDQHLIPGAGGRRRMTECDELIIKMFGPRVTNNSHTVGFGIPEAATSMFDDEPILESAPTTPSESYHSLDTVDSSSAIGFIKEEHETPAEPVQSIGMSNRRSSYSISMRSRKLKTSTSLQTVIRRANINRSHDNDDLLQLRKEALRSQIRKNNAKCEFYERMARKIQIQQLTMTQNLQSAIQLLTEMQSKMHNDDDGGCDAVGLMNSNL